MKKVVEATGKTVEAAILSGASELGVEKELVTYEILTMPKRGFLGFGEIPARVRVTYDAGSESAALTFVHTLISDMGIEADASLSDLPDGKGKLLRITGKDSGLLIGHHGATLDALQYLVNLAANRRSGDEAPTEEDGQLEEAPAEEAAEEEDDRYPVGLKAQISPKAMTAEGSRSGRYQRITVDIENYRAKREETLRQLAVRMADRVLKYKKSVTLEPMNPYERRIIHAEVQKISGVSTTSVGSENERRVVIYPEGQSRRRSQSSARPRAAADKPREKRQDDDAERS